MQTVILCGGEGTRLREETEFKPKPMVNIGPRPILWHIMKIYAQQGHTDFILALGYKGDMIKDYFVHYEFMNSDVTLELGKPDTFCYHCSHQEAGWRITLADTGLKTLKGGRLKRIQKYIKGDSFLMTYGDGLCTVDINALIQFHNSHGKIATLTGINPASRFGELRIEGDQVRTFHEKPQHVDRALTNGGYFVLDKRVFDYVDIDENCDFEYGPLEKLAANGELMVFRHAGFWACMDTLRDVEYLNRLWKEGMAAWKIW